MMSIPSAGFGDLPGEKPDLSTGQIGKQPLSKGPRKKEEKRKTGLMPPALCLS